jgi:glycosyltransferase involved in cell wall biosynthesis
MRLFLDARNPRYNGSWTYIVSLLPKIVELYPDHDYIILYDKEHGPLGLRGVDERVAPGLSPVAWVAWSYTILPALLKKEKVDIYHSLKQMNSFHGPTCKIYTVHGAHHFVYPQLRPYYDTLYWTRLTKAAARTGDQMIAVSESDKRNLAYWAGIPDEEITVIHLAASPKFRPIDDTGAKARVRQRFGLNFPFVLYAGRVDPYKNIVGMLKAFAQALKMNDTGHHLLIVGDKRGYQSSHVFGFVEQLQLSERVTFTGHIHEELEVLYNLADAFLFPSLYEAFGLVLLEAMACGLPVISSRVPGCIDVAGDAGILVDPLNIQQMAEAIVTLLSNTYLRAALSKAGLERAAMFSWERCARETFSLYERLYHTSSAAIEGP